MKPTFILWFYAVLFYSILPPHLIAIEAAADGQTPLEGGDVELRAKAEKGDAEAQFYIGANYIDGIGVPKNVKKALDWYRKSANQGYAEAQFNLGIVYENGLGVEKDDAEAFNWYKKAAEHGHDAAMLNLAQMYQEGRGVSKDEDKAKAWFEKVRQQEKSEGSTMDDIKNMPSSQPPSPQPDQNAAEAQYQLGKKYLYGYGTEIAKDEAQALKLILQAANQGHIEAQAQLAFMYASGRGVLKNEEESVKWRRKAAEQGDADSQSTLARWYAEGKGVTKDPKEAVKWYRMSAEQGNKYDQCHLGLIYEHGKDVAKDPKEAVKWYRMAAEQGFSVAQGCLGNIYYRGRGVTKNYAEAKKWLHEAADQGDANAQANLGVMYENGQGVTKDPKEAVKWYRMAAEQGYAFAQRNLGYMYARGEGVTKNNAEARKWWSKAAEQGEAGAQCVLGIIYAEGVGVIKDYIESYKWILLSSAQDNEPAKKLVPVLERGMTREQMAEGQKLAREFKPRDKSQDKDVTRENLEESRPEATGSGFFITDDGYFITNQHVAGRGATVRVVTASGIIPAKVIKVDELNDLTLLKAEGKFAELPVVLSRKVQLGATVATVGFPNIGLQGFSPKLAKGEIASLAGIQDDARQFQISVPVQPGNSGGALVDEHGNVIGVVVAKLSQKAALATSGALAENVNYAIKSSYLLSFLESVPEVAAKLKEPNTMQRDFETTIKDVEQAAVLVLVY